jgi:hypothetical protein
MYPYVDVPVGIPSTPQAGRIRLYSPDGRRIMAIDPNSNRLTLIENDMLASELALTLPFDGQPVVYDAADAATKMAGTYTVDTNKTVLLTAKVAGVLSPAPKLVVTAAVATVDGANATLGIVSQAAGVVTVRPATSAGAAAVCAFDVGAGGTGHKITTTLTTTGAAGNAKRIIVALPTKADPLGGTMPIPSQAAATGTYSAPNFNILLATGTGTKGILTMTESVINAGSYASFKIETTAAYAGSWGNGIFFCQIYGNSVANGALSVSVDPTYVDVYLATDEEGEIVPITSTTLVGIINNALTAAGLNTKLVATVIGDGSLLFSSTAEQVLMDNGVNAAALTSAANQATAIATLIDTLADTASSVAGTGSDVVAVGGPYSFTGGGLNSAITSTLADLTTLLHAAPSTIIDCAAGAGAQTSLLEATAGVTLTGGTNAVVATYGTPAKLGRMAVGFYSTDSTVKSVWIADVDDLTGTNAATWRKIVTGS